MRVAVIGATGAVGRTMVQLLHERSFPLDDLLPLASARSAGKHVSVLETTFVVEELRTGWHQGVDIALVSAGGAVSRAFLPDAARAGTICIDNSSAFRMHPDVPLVIPEINPEALRGHRNLIANGNCTAITALMAIGPLHRAFGLRFLVTSSYQSVSGAGWKGVTELGEQIEKLHGEEELLARPD